MQPKFEWRPSDFRLQVRGTFEVPDIPLALWRSWDALTGLFCPIGFRGPDAMIGPGTRAVSQALLLLMTCV